MRAGSLQHRVVVLAAEIEHDLETNEAVPTWKPWHEAFASIEVKRGREFFEDNQRHSETIYRLTFHTSDIPGLKPDMRLAFDGKAFDIKSILPDLTRRFSTVVEARELA